MSRTILQKCSNPKCEKTFKAPLREINRGNGKYCSKYCSGNHVRGKRKKVNEANVSCANKDCKKPFYKTPSKMKNSKSGLHFCCRECKDRSQKIGGITKIMPQHYGSSDYPRNYRKTAFNNLPHKCNRCGWDECIDILQVHHIDHDKTNVSIENLEILCPNCHTLYHYLTHSGLYWNLSNS